MLHDFCVFKHYCIIIQVLSETVANALEFLLGDEALETVLFV